MELNIDKQLESMQQKQQLLEKAAAAINEVAEKLYIFAQAAENQGFDCQITTDKWGVIRRANLVAADYLGVERDFLIGKPFVVFVCPENRRTFRHQLNQLQQVFECCWQVKLKTRQRKSFLAKVSVSPIRDGQSEVTLWQWRLCDLSNEAQLSDRTMCDRATFFSFQTTSCNIKSDLPLPLLNSSAI